MSVDTASSSGVLDLTPLRLHQAEERGLTRGRLRGRAWQRLGQGLYGAPDPDRAIRDLAMATTLVLPRESGFGHLSGARLRKWWLPNRLGAHVLLASTASDVHVQRRGLYVRRSKYTETEYVDGLPLVCLPQNLIELARDLSLVDLVPLVDCAMAGGASAADILAAARPRVSGSRTLRQAVALADPKSESWWESILRLQHVLTGLGPVECQVEHFQDGGFVARADLHLVGTNRYPECDGGRHREADRHDEDLSREKRMSRLKLERYGYTTREIAGRPEMIIRDAEDARGLPHDPRRARRWWAAAGCSTLTGYGRARLASRLERYRIAAER